MKKLTVSLLFLCVSTVAAAPPTVDVPPVIKASGDYVTVVPVTNAKAITYVGTSGVSPFPSAFLKDSRSFVLPVRGLPEGTYKFTGVASLNDEHTEFNFSVVIGSGGEIDPAPKPKPKPDPKPEPSPVLEHDGPIWVYIVEETAQRTPTIAGILLDIKYWNDLESKGYKMRPYDKDSPDAKRMKIDTAKDDKGSTLEYPYITFVDGNRKVIRSIPLPSSTANISGILPQIKKSTSVLPPHVDSIKEMVTTFPALPATTVTGYRCYIGADGRQYCVPIQR